MAVGAMVSHDLRDPLRSIITDYQRWCCTTDRRKKVRVSDRWLVHLSVGLPRLLIFSRDFEGLVRPVPVLQCVVFVIRAARHSCNPTFDFEFVIQCRSYVGRRRSTSRVWVSPVIRLFFYKSSTLAKILVKLYYYHALRTSSLALDICSLVLIRPAPPHPKQSVAHSGGSVWHRPWPPHTPWTARVRGGWDPSE